MLETLVENDPSDNAHIIHCRENFEDSEHFCMVFSENVFPLREVVSSLGSQSFELSDIRLIALQILSALALFTTTTSDSWKFIIG